MRLALHDPRFLLVDPARNFNGWAVELVKRTRPVLYLPDRRLLAMLPLALRRNGVSRDDLGGIALTLRGLNRRADVLVDLDGRSDLRPLPPGFQGMKFVHTMDYVFAARESNATFERAGVDWLLGYTDHWRHCSFFRHYYPRYEGRVISVPFGFAPRFVPTRPFAEREGRVVACGAVNPVADPLARPGELNDYIDWWHSRGEHYTHAWRRRLAEHADENVDILDATLLPRFPETKNPSYDAVETMNRFKLYANDEGLMRFPPARTFEGAACGSVMVSSNHPSFHDLGFQDGVNCLMHRRHDLADFRRVVTLALANPVELERVAARSCELVRSRYSHEQVAATLAAEIELRWRGARVRGHDLIP